MYLCLTSDHKINKILKRIFFSYEDTLNIFQIQVKKKKNSQDTHKYQLPINHILIFKNNQN